MKTLHTVKERNIVFSDKFYVLDVETRGLKARPEAFIFGVLYSRDYTHVFYSVDEIKDLLESKAFKNKIIFAHNAEYDLNTIYGMIYDIDLKAIFNGRFIAASNGNCMFADSLNIYPASVKKIGEILGMHKQEIEQDYIEGVKNIKVSKKMIDYCVRDCEIVYTALLSIFQKVGNVKITLAGLSLDYFRRHHQLHHISFNDLTDEFFNSYFGGRTECFKIGDVDACAYDINSMYPYAMLNAKFPNPKYLRLINNLNIDNFIDHILNHFEGIVTCTINHYDTYFGFLPVKYKTKLCFPIGEFSGSWNFNEIRFALKHKAIKILKIEKIIAGNVMESPFKSFVSNVYSERISTDNDLEKLILKLLMNSLYGKFGQRIKSQYMYIKDMYKMVNEIEELKKSGQLIRIVAYSETRKDCFLELKNEKQEKTYNSIPVFSSYITSFSRILLLEYLIKYYKYSPVYCDTDSIFFEKDPKIPYSKELGKWKKEDKTIIEIRGLKNYSYIAENKQIDKIKGIPKSAEKIGENKFRYKNLIKTKEALARQLTPGILTERTKELKNTYDKRNVLENGQTTPLKL